MQPMQTANPMQINMLHNLQGLRTKLEIRRTCERTEGSNPSLSARNMKPSAVKTALGFSVSGVPVAACNGKALPGCLLAIAPDKCAMLR